MQKTATLKKFKVFLFKTLLLSIVLSISFKVSVAQEGLAKPASAKKGEVTERPVTQPQVQQTATSPKKLVMQQAFAANNAEGPTDVPAMNKIIAEKTKSMQPGIVPPAPNSAAAVCTFNGSLQSGDAQLTAARFFRDGVPSTCAAPKGTCPGSFAGGPFYYDSYTMQNLTCASQCVTVTYQANGTSGDCFVTAYSGSFNTGNLCTNYIADGGSSSLAGGASVTFSFTLAANQTVVLVVNEAVANTVCDSYVMTVSGINCTPPPPCVSPTSSVLSQVGGIPVATQVFNQSFGATVPPTGWAVLNNSVAGGLTGWFQGNGAVFGPNSGTDYIAANFNNTSGNNTISNWLFTPGVTLKNGDKFSFFTRTTTGLFPDRLQVRMSTNGTSTNVGTTPTSVGDYSTLLLDINPTYTATGYPTAWTQYTLTMSGLPAAGISGRLAFRYFVESGGPAGANSDYIGIDDAVYTTFTTSPPVTCTGSTANLKVDINGGNAPAYNVTINAAPGGNFTVPNYVSGSNIPVTPTASTTYTLVSVIQADNPCCIGTGNTGTVTITPSATTTQPLLITAAPSTPLCAGDPTLLTVTGAPAAGVSTTASGPISVAIPDNNATGVSTPLTVAGIPAAANCTGIGVLFNITHTWDGDLTLFLKSPNGQVLNLVNQKGGSADNFVNTNITSTATTAIPAAGAPYTGTYMPDGSLAALAPTGFTPTATTFTPLYATNGTWLFAARDNAGGDVGTITNWTLTLNYAIPAGPLPGGYSFYWTPAAGLSNTTQPTVAASPMQTTTYTVLGTAPNGCQTTAAITINVNQLPAITTPPANVTVCAGATATFTAAGTGAGAAYQWQVSTNGGTTWTNLTNAAPYSGVTTGTLTITPTTGAMNGYRYRLVVSGTCPPSAASAGAILTVNALPTIAVTPASPVCGGRPGVNGTLLTATGATTYTWAPTTGLYTNATATTGYTGTQTATVYAAPVVNTVYTVTGTNGTTGCQNTTQVNVVYTPAAPIVNPASATMCLGDVAVPLAITSSLAPAPFTNTYSSGTISVPIPDNTPSGSTSTINVPLPATAQITNMTVAVNISHTWAGDMAIALKAPNNNVLNLDWFISGTGGTGATSGFTNTRFSSSGTAALSSGANPYTGVFKADAAGATASPSAVPTGFGGTLVNNWNALYSTPNGNWTLGAYDGFAGDAGTLTSWSLTFDYLYGPPASGVWTPNGTGAGLYLDANATQLYTGTSVNTVYAKPAASTTYSVNVTSAGFDALPVFTNAAPITIVDGSAGNPYPSNITVSGLPTSGVKVKNVVISGISHTWSDDIDILLQSPTGTNVTLMSDVGGAGILNNVTYTFDDAAAGTMSFTAANATGSYQPTNNGAADTYPAPGPGAISDATPALANFTGNFNGVWKLFVVDDTFGDQGSISGGYSITFFYPTVGCTSASTQVPVTVNIPVTITAQPVNAAVCTDKVTTFSVTATGTSPTYQWQVSTDAGNTFSNIANGGVYAGATTATLTITAPPVSMSGYIYRCQVKGAAPCGFVNSLQRTLTVNPLPTIGIAAAPYTKLLPGIRTTLSSTVSPIAATYTWLKNGTPVSGGTNANLTVDVDGIGDYSLRVTDINGCVNTSATISIKDSVSGKVFIYPNPNSGQFQVRYHSVANNAGLPRGINVYDARGKRISTLGYSVNAPYARMDVDLRNYGSGVYWIEVVDANGNRLAMGRADVIR